MQGSPELICWVTGESGGGLELQKPPSTKVMTVLSAVTAVLPHTGSTH